MYRGILQAILCTGIHVQFAAGNLRPIQSQLSLRKLRFCVIDKLDQLHSNCKISAQLLCSGQALRVQMYKSLGELLYVYVPTAVHIY